MIAIRTLLTLTLLLGVGYPLAVTGLAQLMFPWQANGSQLTNGKQQLIGSALLALPPRVAKSLAEGREWKYSARSNFCASRALPISCCLPLVS